MALTWLIFIQFGVVLQYVIFSQSQTPANTYRAGYFCSSTGNFTAGSTYQSNLQRLLSSFSSRNDIDYGFYNVSEGQDGDKVNAIGLCRGDIMLNTCLSCLNQSNYELLQLCPAQKEAIIWFDNCMLRYSDQSIFSHPDNDVIFRLYNVNNVTNVTQFDQALSELLVTLTDKAASGDSTLKFATGEASIAPFERVYALVQCTPDLTQLQCSQCLTSTIRVIAPPSIEHGKIGARVLCPSCNFRFESSQFFNPASSPPPPPPAPQPPSPLLSPTPFTQGTSSSNNGTLILIVVSAVVGVIVIFIISICLFLKARKSKKKIKEVVAADEIVTVESLRFDLAAIKDATDDFCLANKLGEGGFGTVYKGTLLNGQKVAVKRLSVSSEQGEEEFKNEVILVAKLQHRNLVKLQGFCLEGQERILIYEFVPNRSLDQFIFDHTRRLQLKWECRLKIIGGISRGLLYLHEDSRLRIIHRDLKASNVLLDEEMNPKISDFGMARLFSVDETQEITSRVVGTYGYMAPEYARRGQFSMKSDVYSFGVLVLEIVSGQKNNAFESGERSGSGVESLISYAWKSWREGTPFKIVDPTIDAESRTELMRCIHIGLLCVQENAEARPNMASVLVMLSSSSLTLPIPSQPGFFMHSTMEQETIQHNSGTNFSANEASFTEFHPR